MRYAFWRFIYRYVWQPRPTFPSPLTRDWLDSE